MEKYEIDKLRELPIEGVADRLGLDVKRHRCLCCFHDDHTPSMSFSVSRNTYKCWVCGAQGDVIDLARNVLNKGFVETCQWLADASNVILSEWGRHRASVKPSHAAQVDTEYLTRLVAYPKLNDAARRFLFEDRHINPAVVRWLGISSITSPMPMQKKLSGAWFNGPALLIPYKDIDGRLMSVQARYLGTEDRPRFQFPKGSSCHVYNMPVVKMLKDGEPLYITEGVSDCMAMLSAGHKAIAIPSATLLKPDDLEPVFGMMRNGRCGSLHMYPDNDEPGERLYLQLRDLIFCHSDAPLLVRHSLPSGCKDFGDMWKLKSVTCHPSPGIKS